MLLNPPGLSPSCPFVRKHTLVLNFLTHFFPFPSFPSSSRDHPSISPQQQEVINGVLPAQGRSVGCHRQLQGERRELSASVGSDLWARPCFGADSKGHSSALSSVCRREPLPGKEGLDLLHKWG